MRAFYLTEEQFSNLIDVLNFATDSGPEGEPELVNLRVLIEAAPRIETHFAKLPDAKLIQHVQEMYEQDQRWARNQSNAREQRRRDLMQYWVELIDG